MDEIARQAGVSPGLLYSYAEGKEALFQLAQLRELGVDISGSDAAGAEAERGMRCESVAQARVQGARRHPRSRGGAADGRRPGRRREPELAPIVDRALRTACTGTAGSSGWPNAPPSTGPRWPSATTPAAASPHVRRLGQYIAARVESGDFAPVPDPEVAARFVIETVAWFANHRYGDFDGAQIPDDVAQATVVQLVTAGLIGRDDERDHASRSRARRGSSRRSSSCSISRPRRSTATTATSSITSRPAAGWRGGTSTIRR